MPFLLVVDILVILVDIAKVHVEAPVRSKKVSRWNIPAPPNYDKEIEVVASKNSRPSLLTNEKKHETRKIVDVSSANKVMV